MGTWLKNCAPIEAGEWAATSGKNGNYPCVDLKGSPFHWWLFAFDYAKTPEEKRAIRAAAAQEISNAAAELLVTHEDT